MGAPHTSDAVNAYERFIATKHFSGLDALRAFSILAVIWSHVTADHALALLAHGNKGVDFFFAISGFLVTSLLLREYAANQRIALGAFYMRRTLRIFPLYYAVLLLYVVLVGWMLEGTPKADAFWTNLPAFASYTSNWFVAPDSGSRHGVTFYFAWSLATEEQFYLFWPSLMVLVLTFTRRSSMLAVAALSLLAIQVAAHAAGPASFIAVVLASMAPAILFGVVFAVLLNDRRSFVFLYGVLGRRWMAPLALLATLACLQFGAPANLARFLMAVIVACVCAREDTWLHPVLRWRPLVFVGTISYGIYLLHMLAANVARVLLHREFGIDVFLGTLAVVVPAAYLSYRYFESPLLSLKSRFPPGRRRHAFPPAMSPGA